MILNHLAAIGVLAAVFLLAYGPWNKKKEIEDPTEDYWNKEYHDIWRKSA